MAEGAGGEAAARGIGGGGPAADWATYWRVGLPAGADWMGFWDWRVGLPAGAALERWNG